MPYLQIDTSGLESRVGGFEPTSTDQSSDRTFGRMHLRTSPRAARGSVRSFNGNVTTAMSVSPLVATVLGVLGVAVLGFGIVAALPNGGASASEPVDTTSLQTAVETLREENTALLEENRTLKQEIRQAQRGELAPASLDQTTVDESETPISGSETTSEDTEQSANDVLPEAQEAGANLLLR